jgi:alanine dehydrogenase
MAGGRKKMIVGVPREIKNNEYRIAIVPGGVRLLVGHGHKVLIEKSAGAGSGIPDADYKKVGATIVDRAKDIWKRAQMIYKVKEPLPEEYELVREDHIFFTYFHFASSEELTRAMIERKAICVAYETVETEDGKLPLLEPMSEVAGRLSIQEGAKYLERPMGGRGVLLGGVPGVEPAEVLVIGGGAVGAHAARMAAGLGARVTILDINVNRLRYLADVMPPNVTTLLSSEHNIRQKIKTADLVVGAVLIAGAKAPKLITRDMLRTMKRGSVIVDVAIDQGGCTETSRPTTHSEPVYEVSGVIHYCVANMPGAVSRTSTFALTNATIPYAVKLADKGFPGAVIDDEPLRKGVNMVHGKVTNKPVAEAFGLPYTPIEKLLK